MHIREGLLGSIRINLLCGLMFYPEHGVIRFIRSIKYSGRVLRQCAVPYHSVWYHTTVCSTIPQCVVPYHSVRYHTTVCGTIPQFAVPYHRRCNCHSHSHENLKSHIHYSHYPYFQWGHGPMFSVIICCQFALL